MWEAYLFQTTTGQIGPRVGFEGASWSIPLNEIETFKINLRKSELPNVDLNYWLAPWWAGVVYMWNGIPIFAGPIIGEPSQSFNYLHVECKGIRQVLAKRLAVNEQIDWTKLAEDWIEYKGLSLGTIAQRVVKVAMAKPGGGLPISFPLPEQSVVDDADHQRTYDSFNIQNINCDAILTKLSNVSRGPDIMFKPRLIHDDQLTIDMWHGTEEQPRIVQSNNLVWDATTQMGEVTDMDIIRTGAYQTSRVYSSGAGQDRGTLIRVAEDLSRTAEGFPLLETTISYSETTSGDVAYGHALGALEANKDALLEFQLGVRGDGVNGLGTFWSGDLVEVKLKDVLGVEDGIHKMRLLNMSGSDKTDVRLSLQIED